MHLGVQTVKTTCLSSNRVSVSALSSPKFAGNGTKKIKYPVSNNSLELNALLVPELSGKWTDWLEIIKIIERQY